MKRYLIFVGDGYYPSGGMNDFINDSDNIEDAIEILDNNILIRQVEKGITKEKIKEWIWAHIWDNESRSIVYDTHPNVH